MHLGGARWAAVGDSLARILAGQGAQVSREYYFNDHGAQIDRFARSLLAAAQGQPTPEDGYGGDYIGEIAQRVVADQPGRAGAARRRGAGGLPARGRRADVRRDQGEPARRSASTSTSTSTRTTCTSPARSSGPSPGCASRATSTRRTARSGCAPASSATTRTASSSRATASRRYFSGDLAYYLDKRERGFDRVVIMLGADHHGYIGRMMAMCACFGDTPGVNLEILIGQLVNLVKDGQPVRMSKRAGTIVTMEDLVDAVGVDAARYALGALLGRLPDRHRPRPADQAHQRQPGLLRAVRPRAHGRRDPARRGRRRPHRGRLRPVAADPRDRVACCSRARRVPARRRAGGRRCASRTGSPATSSSSPATSTAGTTSAGCVPESADDPVTDLNRTRLWLNRGHRSGARQRPWPAWGFGPGPDVADARPRGRRAARGARPRPGLAAGPDDVNALVPRLWATSVQRAADGALRGRRRRRARTSPASTAPRRTRSTRPTSEPGGGVPDAFTRRVRRQRRRLLRRQGVPVHGGRPLDGRGRAAPSTSAPAASSPSRCAPVSPPARIGLHGNNKSDAELDRAVAAGIGRVVVDGVDEIDRLAEARPPARRAGVAGPGAGHGRRRGPHPRVHRHGPRGPEVRPLARRRPGPPRPSTWRWSTPTRSSCAACTPTSAARSSTRPASRSPLAGSLGLHAQLATSSAASCPSSTSAAASASPTRPSTTRCRPASWPTGWPRSSTRECAQLGVAVPRLSVEPGRAIAGPSTCTLYDGRHGQGGRARRRAGPHLRRASTAA